jgi:hypothetical protein
MDTNLAFLLDRSELYIASAQIRQKKRLVYEKMSFEVNAHGGIYCFYFQTIQDTKTASDM